MSSLIIKSEIFDLKFTKEISIKPDLSITEKKALLISFDYQGEELTGEVPLLPSFLPLDLNTVLNLLDEVKLNGEEFDLSRPYFNLLQGPLDSQILFAFESALLPLITKRFRLEISKNAPLTQVLLFANHSTISQNLAAVKIKIGREHFTDELKYCEEVRAKNPKAIIRLDPNRLLDTSEIELLHELVSKLDINAIEVSVREFLSSDLKGLPLLLDDVPENYSQVDLALFKALVFKPALGGGLSRMFALAKNYNICISSTYESWTGLDSMALAARVAKLQGPQGLGTRAFLTPRH